MNFNDMCFNLAKNILLIESKKEKIANKQCHKLSLCNCKNKMIEIYLTNCQILLIKITSLILKYNETKDDEKFDVYIDEIYEWFQRSNYNNTTKSNELSIFNINLFKLIQKKIDENMFKFIKQNLVQNIMNCIKNKNIEEKDLDIIDSGCFDMLYTKLCDWFELAIFSSITISKLNCSNFNYKLKDENDNIIIDTNYYNEKNINECDIKMNLINNQESTRLIYTVELTDSYYDFYYDWLKILIKNHKNYNDILVEFDFILFKEKFVFQEINYKTFKYAIDNFKNVVIINYENVDFNKYTDEVKLFFKNKEQINI